MDNQLVELDLADWSAAVPNEAWIAALEAGKVLYFPRLAFELLDGEDALLTPALLSPDVRNISLDANGQIKGVVGDADVQRAAAAMVGRFRAQAQQLVHGLLPQYTAALRYAPTSYRPRKWSRECSRGGRMTGVCMLIRFLRGPITVNGFCGCSPTPTPTANPVSGGWGSRLKTWRGAFCRVPSLIHAGRPRCCTSCV